MNSTSSLPLKKALITGIRGQDGFYLGEVLLSQNYQVMGTSHEFTGQLVLSQWPEPVEVAKIDLTSMQEVQELIETFRPDEVYNLAARSSSAQLFDDPIATAEINGLATVRFLEAIRLVSPLTRFCQAASSEVFAGTDFSPQDEGAALKPVNAYGAAKAYGLNMVEAYRNRYGLHAGTAILFNHESPRRGKEYVTRKISRGVAMIDAGREDSLILGGLENRRDWSFAADVTRAMWLMLQQPAGGDFVIATGETHSVREFCEVAFAHVGLDYRGYVRTDESLSRRVDSVELRGNTAKAQSLLGWRPSVSFEELVRLMVDADRERIVTGEED
jgi:GDPmannose 4,6-dehydratase